MTRLRDPSTTPWFRRHDPDAHHALRQGGVLPWEPPLETEALADYGFSRWIDYAVSFENLPAPSPEQRVRDYENYMDWLRITLRQVG